MRTEMERKKYTIGYYIQHNIKSEEEGDEQTEADSGDRNYAKLGVEWVYIFGEETVKWFSVATITKWSLCIHPFLHVLSLFQCGKSQSQHALDKKQGASPDISPLGNTDKWIHSFGRFRENI